MSELKEKNIKPICAWDDSKKIYFVYRDENRNKKVYTIEDFEWYFCLKTKEYVQRLAEIKEINYKTSLEKSEEYSNNKYKNSWIEKTPAIIKVKKVGEFVKIYCDRSNVNTIRFLKRLRKSGFETKESDLSLTKRYMVDNIVEIEEDLSVLFFDIETHDGNPGIVIGRDRILSWAACDLTGKKFFSLTKTLTDEDERILIKKLLQKFMEYDLIVGWNSRQFDVAYIQSRIETLRITGEDFGEIVYNLNQTDYWKKIVHIDLMQRLIKLFGPMMTVVNLTGFSLNEVAKVFIGDQKIEREEKVHTLYEENQEKLKKYNLKDAKLLFKINEKLRTIPLMIKECAWTGTFLNRFYIGELLDNYILREATYQNFHLRSRPGWGENDENQKIRGGYVMEPKTGMYDSVRTLDFKSMYPSIIVGWNIGQESLVEGRVSRTAEEDFLKWIEERKLDDVPYKEWHEFLAKENKKLNPDNLYYQTANNQFFKRDKQSIIAGLVKRLLQERKSYKKQQIDSVYNSIEYKNAQASQEAVKEMSNSMYGINADKQARYFDPKIAEAITMTGQFLNRMSMSILEEMGYLVIYGDTDSIFIVVESDEEMEIVINSLNEALSQRLVDNYQFLENIVFIEYEKKFSKFIMLDKKRYAGYLVEIDGKPVNSILSKGTENVRKSTINFTKKKVNECLDLLLKQHKSKTFMKEWIRDLKEYVLDGDIPSSDLAITMKLSKPISSYKSKPPHVRLAEKLIENNEILETYEGKSVWGQKIEYIVIDSKNKNESILLRDFNGVWDRKYYWDVQVYAPLMRILKAVWPESNWEEHNIILFEKMQKKIEKEKEKEQKKKENEQKKKEKAQKKKEKGAIKKEKGFKKGKQLKLAL